MRENNKQPPQLQSAEAELGALDVRDIESARLRRKEQAQNFIYDMEEEVGNIVGHISKESRIRTDVSAAVEAFMEICNRWSDYAAQQAGISWQDRIDFRSKRE